MKDDLEKLEKYESWFHSAVYANYIRALWADDINIMKEIYTKWTSTEISINGSCGKCKLAFVKELGKLYYKNKEIYEREQEQTSGEPRLQSNPRGTSDNRCKGERSSNNVSKGRKPKTNKTTKK